MKTIRPPLRRELIRVISLLWLTLPLQAMALDSDQDQPIYLEADDVQIDDRTGVSVYTGNVIFDQGTMHLTADKLTIIKEGGETDEIIAEGNPARFQQQTGADKGLAKGRAKRMEYKVRSDLVYLIDDAEITQDGDAFKNDRITYNRTTKVVRAGTSQQGKQRVRITIRSNKQRGVKAPRKEAQKQTQ